MRSPRTEAERAVTRRLVHGGYAAFNRGEVARALGALPEDLEWQFVPDLLDVGTLRGRATIVRMFERLREDFEYQANIEDYQDDGERIVLRVDGMFRARHTGLRMELVFTQTWDYDDGHLVIRERRIASDSGVAGLMPRGAQPH
jgi:ketosteroid isomerase-like protein